MTLELTCFVERQTSVNARPPAGPRRNVARPPELFRALTHRNQANAEPMRRTQPLPIVADLDLEPVIDDGELNATDLRLSMPDDIRDRLLDDTVGGDLDRSGQRRKLLRSLNENVRAA
jgi:hypothetical protein